MEIVLWQESATLPCEGIFRSAFIWLLYLDANRIQVIPVSGLQVEYCFDQENSIVLIIQSEGAHTQGISVF